VVLLAVLWDIVVCSKSKYTKTMRVLQIHVVAKTIGFMTMYETSECPTIMVDATSCRKLKMAANEPEVVIPKL